MGGRRGNGCSDEQVGNTTYRPRSPKTTCARSCRQSDHAHIKYTHTHAHTTCRQQRILPCYSHNRIYTAFDYIGVYYTKYFVEGCEILPHIRTFKFVWFSAQTRIITCYIVCKTTQNIQILSLILVEEDDARFFFLQLESMCKIFFFF